MKAAGSRPRSPSSTTGEGFVVVPENKAAALAVRRLARAVIAARTLPFSSLYLHGLPGTGKSHLAQWLLQRVIAQMPSLTVRLIPARELARLLAEPATRKIRDFHDCDLLIVEDVQHLPLTGAADLANLIDHRQERRKPLLLTSGSGPARLTRLPQRLTSRLAGGLVVRLESLAIKSRLQLARSFCERRRLRVTDAVVEWLARLPAGGARAMQGDLHLLEELYSVHAGPLDLPAVKAAAGKEIDTPMLDQLTEQVASHFGLSPRHLKSRARQKSFLWPRQVGMYLARQISTCSLQRIGTQFGGYDHSTVLHACRKVSDRLKEDPVLASELAELVALTS